MKNNTWIRRIKRMGIVFASVVILLFVVTLIILPYSKGIPEPFLDEFGEVIEGSISG